MNGNRLVCDTNVALYLLKGEEEAAKILHDKELYLSVITEIELLSFKDLAGTELAGVQSFISDCIVVEINSYVKELTIELRKKYNLKIPDAIIAGTAMFLNLPLITSDKKLKSIKDQTILFYER